MAAVRTELKLCTYSRSDLLASSVLAACPIELRQGEHDYCPCRKREIHQAGRIDVRVLTCTWPKLWNGREVMNPPAFAEAVQKSCHLKLQTDRTLAKIQKAKEEEMGKQNGKVTVADPPEREQTITEAEVMATTAVVPAAATTEISSTVGSAPVPRVPIEIPATLAGALALAQAKCLPAKKDSRNTHHGYRYASADAVIAEAKAALRDTGLALIPSEVALNRTESGLELFRRFTLVHTSGATMQLQCAWPVEVEKGRPLDKATAIASTTSLAYMLRDLLMIPRVMPDGDMDSRTDAKPAAVSARAAKEAAQKPQPASATESKGITEEQLDRLVNLRGQLDAIEKWQDKPAEWKKLVTQHGAESAKGLTATQADALIQFIASKLTTRDLEKAMAVGSKGG